MSSCSNFSEHAWKKDLCTNCFCNRSDHQDNLSSRTIVRNNSSGVVRRSTSANRQNKLSLSTKDIQVLPQLENLTISDNKTAANSNSISSNVFNEQKRPISKDPIKRVVSTDPGRSSIMHKKEPIESQSNIGFDFKQTYTSNNQNAGSTTRNKTDEVLSKRVELKVWAQIDENEPEKVNLSKSADIDDLKEKLLDGRDAKRLYRVYYKDKLLSPDTNIPQDTTSKQPVILKTIPESGQPSSELFHETRNKRNAWHYSSNAKQSSNNEVSNAVLLKSLPTQYSVNTSKQKPTDVSTSRRTNKHNDSDDDNDTDNERPVKGSLHKPSSSRKPPCRNEMRCFIPFCPFDHPAGWDACEDGEGCKDFDCKANHPHMRKKPCRNGHRCTRPECHFLHPMPEQDKCQDRDQCRRWKCKKWHPRGRPKDCIYGKQCYNTACSGNHRGDRDLCPNGVDCDDFDCQLDHPPSRLIRCVQGGACTNFFCTFLHPRDWDPCEQGSKCKNPSCPHTTHPLDRILPDDEEEEEGKIINITKQSHRYRSLKSYNERSHEREQMRLPILAAKDEFCQRLKKERILVVTAETGSGKSTQLPQYAAEYFGGLVICTQPRVIAAISLARRVADEYDGMSVGLSVGYRVGYTSIGKDKNRVPGTDILFMTDGTFIQESQTGSLLSEVRVLIIDEAHERTLNTDIVLGLAKRLLDTRPTDFYVVISSATIDPSRFLAFFQRTDAEPLKVEGRVHSVTVENILPSNGYIEKHVVSTLLDLYDQHEGNTLVFLSGQREIENAMEIFDRRNKLDNCIALPLYGALSPEEQNRVLQFDEGEDGKLRMIVFCTNIAETSLTIKNIRLVIDSGLAKEAHFDHRSRVIVVESVKISRASADQRKGRAGRTAPGHYVRLYDNDDLVRPNITPEILRASLDLVVLQLIRLGLNPLEFPFMDPPDEAHIQTSLDRLEDLSCVDTDYIITRKGELFAKLGIEPRYSAFLLDTYLEHAPILEFIATIVAILVAPSPIFSITGETPEEKEAGRKRIADNAKKFDSDFDYLVSTYKSWHSQGIIDPTTRMCPTCRKSYNKGYACGPCRAAYSRTHLLSNKTLNYSEGMSDDLITTITDPRWQLDPNSLSDANESVIIAANLFKYFPERHGRLIVPRLPKLDAFLFTSKLSVRISDNSAFVGRQDDNVQFIAMSVVKLPNGTYIIDRLHPYCPSSDTLESDNEDHEDKMSACSNFIEHAWKNDLCCNCSQKKCDHPNSSISNTTEQKRSSAISSSSSTD